MHTTIERSPVTEKSTWNVQIMSVNAVLIATVAFTAAFTLPKHEDPHDADFSKYSAFYQITVISDTLAFCSSISSAVLLMYALYGKQEDPPLLKLSLIGLWIALISLLLTFGTCIYVVMAPLRYYTVTRIVLVMLCIVPICIRMMIFRSKKYIFREDERHLWALFIIIFVNMILTVTFQIGFMKEVGIFVGLMVVWIGVSMGPKRFFHSQPHISGDNGLSIWFFSVGSIVTIGFILLLLAPLLGTRFNPFRTV